MERRVSKEMLQGCVCSLSHLIMAQPEGVIPSQEDLLAELQALKLANPEMGAKRLQAAVKEKNSTWLVSEARVKKVAVEAGLLKKWPLKRGCYPLFHPVPSLLLSLSTAALLCSPNAAGASSSASMGR